MSTADNSYFLNTIAQNLSNLAVSSSSSSASASASTSTTTSSSVANNLASSSSSSSSSSSALTTSNLGQSASCVHYQQQHPLVSGAGTTSVALMDELVKEYLLYRGFTSAFRAFDHDLRNDRDRSFRVDKITEQLLHHIHAFDLTGFLDYWNYLDQKYFSKLIPTATVKSGGGGGGASGASGVNLSLTRRYELNLMRYYLVNAMRAGKPEKAFEFFETYSSKLQSHGTAIEWKEWYSLPFVKLPDEHPFFSVYFSPTWIDSLVVSFQNFLSVLFQSLPFPRLLNYDENQFWLKHDRVSKLSFMIQIFGSF